MYVCIICMYVYIYMYVCMCVCMCVCIICMYVCIICMYVCMYLCMYVPRFSLQEAVSGVHQVLIYLPAVEQFTLAVVENIRKWLEAQYKNLEN
jgi:hypothetical protein